MGIKIRHYFTLFLVLAITSFFCNNSPSQNIQKKSARQTALEKYNAGLYEQAYKEFSGLLQIYTKDPQYKYYSAICLIKINRDPEKAMSLLQEAVDGSIDIKAIPDDAWFYLGRSQQLSGRFNEAIRSFNHFSEIAGRKVSGKFGVSKFVQECNEGKGQLKESDYMISDVLKNAGDSLAPEEQKNVDENILKKPVIKPVQVKENLPADYDRTLSEALDYQVKADSLTALAADYKNEFERLPASQKPSGKARIDELEAAAAGYQKLADEKFSNSDRRAVLKKDSVTIPPVSKKPEQSTGSPETQPLKNSDVPAGSDKSPIVMDEKPVYSVFDIADLKTIKNQKIPIDPEMPPGLVYRIQIAVFSKPVAPSLFKGITPISGFRVPGTESIRYYAGMFRKSEDAKRALLRVKQAGFRDAFLNAVSDGKVISIDRALLLEKEWGNKPLFTSRVPAATNTVAAGPATLSFRVEVLRSDKPVKEDVVENYKKLAGTRGFEILTIENDSLAYLIGKFITFESASEYANLLVRNGHREARVVAYLGNKEIPVETATQLFEKIK
jgi:tetratricopeptide (TPR) repeat protein